MVGSIPTGSITIVRNMNMSTHHIVERYRRARERLGQARMRGGEGEVDRLQDELDGLWRVMSDADRRTVLGVGVGGEEKRAAA